MKKYQLDLTVKACVQLSERAFQLVLTHPQPLPEMLPGQFVQIQAPDRSVMLRRPISIHDVDRDDNTLHLLVQRVGDGTRSLAAVREGDTLNVVLPLGNGFPICDGKRVLLAGGGIGIAPLLHLGRELVRHGCTVDFLLGGRTKTDILRLGCYKSIAPVHITTEDGSLGEQGFVTNHSVLSNKVFDTLMVCGPTPMMRAVAAWARKRQVDCYVSLENMMACGLGACLCCVQKDKDGHNRCVCKEGPVFNINDLDF
ncbi:MAG: dihydroorotate dehydrogenase electron transfer subunit [Bacteroidaceae bacterium]|nr:dihydroorotate dehydrogenase electron transfer subunit [Bacteroidaceae bacterium]